MRNQTVNLCTTFALKRAEHHADNAAHSQSLLFLIDRLQRGLGLDGLLRGDVTTHDRSFFSNRLRHFRGYGIPRWTGIGRKVIPVCTLGRAKRTEEQWRLSGTGPIMVGMSETTNSPTPIEVPVRTRSWQSMVMVVCAGFMCLAQTAFAAQRFGQDSAVYV